MQPKNVKVAKPVEKPIRSYELYPLVVKDVIEELKLFFEEEGIPESTLVDFQKSWETEMNEYPKKAFIQSGLPENSAAKLISENSIEVVGSEEIKQNGNLLYPDESNGLVNISSLERNEIDILFEKNNDVEPEKKRPKIEENVQDGDDDFVDVVEKPKEVNISNPPQQNENEFQNQYFYQEPSSIVIENTQIINNLNNSENIIIEQNSNTPNNNFSNNSSNFSNPSDFDFGIPKSNFGEDQSYVLNSIVSQIPKSTFGEDVIEISPPPIVENQVFSNSSESKNQKPEKLEKNEKLEEVPEKKSVIINGKEYSEELEDEGIDELNGSIRGENEKEEKVSNVLISQAENVKRGNRSFKIKLRNGIMQLDGIEYAFKSSSGFWIKYD